MSKASQRRCLRPFETLGLAEEKEEEKDKENKKEEGKEEEVFEEKQEQVFNKFDRLSGMAEELDSGAAFW